MFGYRSSTVWPLKALVMAFALVLAPTFAVKADPCDDARKAADAADPNVAKAVSLGARSMLDDDPVDKQKTVCEEKKVWLAIARETVRRHEMVDRACGTRVRWQTCDTACAREQLRKSETESADVCSSEAIKKAQASKEELEKKRQQVKAEIDNADVCTHIELVLDKSEASNPEWPAWIKACNETDRDVCTRAWFSLERVGIPTTGLTCRPNAQERASKRALEKEMKSSVNR